MVALVLAGSVVYDIVRAPVTDREAARESLDLLKAMAASGTGQVHVSSCVAAIAGAVRLETREDVGAAAVQRGWHEAAGRCHVMLHVLCSGGAGPAGHEEACTSGRAPPMP
jgi:ammonia channel protein AmtB